MKTCTTHHYSCDCREEKFAQLERELAAMTVRCGQIDGLKQRIAELNLALETANKELAAVTAERDELAEKKTKLVSYNNQLAMWLAKAQQEQDKLTAERDDYAERWHELAVKQPDIDAVVARLRKTEAERDALAQTSGELLASIMGEWHDVRSAPPGPDYHDGWNAALLCVAEILKASNAGTEARVPPSPPVTVGRANQTTKGE